MFDPEGRTRARLRLPVEIQMSPLPIVTGDRIYAVHAGELGAPHLVIPGLRR